MAEPNRNDADIDAGLQQVHRLRVASRVQRDLPRRQSSAGFRSNLDGAIQSLHDVVVIGDQITSVICMSTTTVIVSAITNQPARRKFLFMRWESPGSQPGMTNM